MLNLLLPPRPRDELRASSGDITGALVRFTILAAAFVIVHSCNSHVPGLGGCDDTARLLAPAVLRFCSARSSASNGSTVSGWRAAHERTRLGIGFLAGGVIFREGLSVRGLNTAATLWATAAVGTLAGFGFLTQAAVGALAVMAANVLLRPAMQHSWKVVPTDDEEQTMLPEA